MPYVVDRLYLDVTEQDWWSETGCNLPISWNLLPPQPSRGESVSGGIEAKPACQRAST